MIVIVAFESASIGGTIIRNRSGGLIVRCHYSEVEIHHAFACNSCRYSTHSMRGVADGAGEPSTDVQSVFVEAGI